MAYYAYLDENNVVTQVIRGKDEGEDGVDWEAYYGAKRTSYNTRGGIYYDPNTGEPAQDQSKSFRKNYAGIGFTYYADIDGFVPPKPYPSWILNAQTGLWDAPIPYPNDGKNYRWDEATQTWIEVEPIPR